MAEVPLDQAVPRFTANENRLDIFVNNATGYTTSGGVDVQSIQEFLASIGSNGIDFVDNAKARFGTGNDLQIYHDGSNSYIKEGGTGNLFIDATSLRLRTGAGTETYLTADGNGSVDLYYDNAKKLETTSTGIDVTGDILLDSDNAEINLKSGITGTSGAVNWTFNTTTTNYASLNLNYDTRATTGFHIDSGYPITIDSSGIGTRFAYGGTEQMRLTNTGRLGVGHTSPVAKMAILGSSNSTITEANSNLCVEGSGGNGMLFGTLSTTGFKSYIQSGFVSNLGTATYDLLLNPEGGNVGVGLSAPTQKLEIAGKIQVTSADPEIFLTDTTTGVDHSIDGNSGVGNLFIHVDKNNEGSDPKLQINVGDGTGLFCIEEGGDTGVGTTNPANRLHIFDDNSNIDMNSSANGQLHIDGSGYGFAIALNTQGANIYTNVGTRDIIFGTNETERMRVSDIGVICTRYATTSQNQIDFVNPNGTVGRISTDGSATTYATSSDYRLKTDAQPMQGSIDRVKALNPVNFEWIAGGTRVDGFLAHEAQSVVPEAVTGTQDGMQDEEYVVSEATGDIYTPAVQATYETIQVELTPAVEATYDEDGNELTPAVDATYEEQQQELTPAIDEVIHSSDVVEPDTLEEGQLWRETTERIMATRQVPDYQGIDQSKIVPLLTSALQDAIAKIEALETRLVALEA